MLRLGFFPSFKGSDTVLLSGLPEDIEQLSAQLIPVVSGVKPALALHELATVALNHPVTLVATQSSSPLRGPHVFSWVCDANSQSDIKAKLGSLAGSGKGHQYFELAGSATTLMVSVGEYSDDWWQSHG
jgi:hypothetical protein